MNGLLIVKFPDIICVKVRLARVKIVLLNSKPVLRRSFPYPTDKQEALRYVINGLLTKGVITKSSIQYFFLLLFSSLRKNRIPTDSYVIKGRLTNTL